MLQELHNRMEKENASSISVQYRCRHLNMYIFSLTHYSDDYYYYYYHYYFIVLIIVKMIVEWSPFFQKFNFFIVDVCNIPFTLEFDLSIEIKEFMFSCLAEN